MMEFQQFLEEELKETHVVLLHEWNDPQVVNRVLAIKEKLGFIGLFHDIITALTPAPARS